MGAEEEQGKPLRDAIQAERDLGKPVQTSEDAPRRRVYTGSTRQETNTLNMEHTQPTPLLLLEQLANNVTKTRKKGWGGGRGGSVARTFSPSVAPNSRW